MLMVVGGALFAISTTAFFRVALLPSIGDELAMAPTALGLVTTAFAIGRLLTDIPAGKLADHVAPAYLMAYAALGIGIGSLLFAVADVPLSLYAAGLALGVSTSLANTTGMTFFSTRARPGRRGTSLALYSVALLGGQAFGPAFGGLFSGLGTWRTAELIGGAIGIATALALLVAPAARGARRRDDVSSAVQRDTVIVARTGEYAVLYVVSFASFFALGSMPQTIVPIIAADNFDLSASAIGLALGLGGLCRLVGTLIGGVISDHRSRKIVLIPALSIMAVGVALLAVPGRAGLWLLAIALLSFGSAGMSVTATMLADRTPAPVVGRRFGVYRLSGDCGLMTGPVLAGFLYTHVSRTSSVLVVSAVLAAAIVASALVLKEAKHGPAQVAPGE